MFDQIWSVLSTVEEPEHKKIWLLDNMKLYERVLNQLKKKKKHTVKILDIGCGRGHGTYFIGNNLPKAKVLGVDIDKKIIDSATRTWMSDNLNFATLDILDPKSANDLRKSHGSFDIVICFEILEHLPPESMTPFFHNLRSLMDYDSFLFLSTPNKEIYDLDAFTEDHINEMELKDVKKLFGKNGFKVKSCQGISSLNLEIIKVLSAFELGIREGNLKNQLGPVKKLIRKGAITLLYPKRVFSTIFRIINPKLWREYHYNSIELNGKNLENSSILLFFVKRSR